MKPRRLWILAISIVIGGGIALMVFSVGGGIEGEKQCISNGVCYYEQKILGHDCLVDGSGDIEICFNENGDPVDGLN